MAQREPLGEHIVSGA